MTTLWETRRKSNQISWVMVQVGRALCSTSSTSALPTCRQLYLRSTSTTPALPLLPHLSHCLVHSREAPFVTLSLLVFLKFVRRQSSGSRSKHISKKVVIMMKSKLLVERFISRKRRSKYNEAIRPRQDSRIVSGADWREVDSRER